LSDNSTEEKVLPPSQHKLEKAREKGQVAASGDFVAGISAAIGLVYVVFNWKTFFDIAARISDLTNLSIANSSPDRALAIFLTMLFESAGAVAPLIALVIVSGIVTNLLHKRGIPFSLHPVKPDFAKINPGAGLKKLFSRRNATEFAQALGKLIVWFGLCALFLWLSLQTILASIYCSLGCVIDASLNAGLLILVAGVILLVASGLIDLPLQIALFHHEQKMGHKEAKREMKELMGSPEFKSHRRSEYQKLVFGNGGTGKAENGGGSGRVKDGVEGITLILRAPEKAVGLYYHPEHADVPMLVARFQGAQMAKELAAAQSHGIPVMEEATLANDLYRTIDVGKVVRERHFEKVARFLVQIGVIGG